MNHKQLKSVSFKMPFYADHYYSIYIYKITLIREHKSNESMLHNLPIEIIYEIYKQLLYIYLKIDDPHDMFKRNPDFNQILLEEIKYESQNKNNISQIMELDNYLYDFLIKNTLSTKGYYMNDINVDEKLSNEYRDWKIKKNKL